MAEVDLKPLILRLLIGCLCVVAFVAITGIVVGSFGETQWRITLTALSFGLFSLTAMLATKAAEREALVALGGLACSALAALLCFAAIWSDDHSESLERWTAAFGFLAITAAHMGVLIGQGHEGESDTVALVRRGTILVSGLLGALVAIGNLTIEDDPGGAGRLMGVLAVVAILGTLVLPVLRKLEAQAAER
jgi:hypothetical protein